MMRRSGPCRALRRAADGQLADWGRKATLAAERIPGPLHRMRGRIFFPAARGAPENTIDYFIRVLMPREAWMHRTDIAIAAQRPVGVGAQDGEVVRQVIRDLASAWSRPAVILDIGEHPGLGRRCACPGTLGRVPPGQRSHLPGQNSRKAQRLASFR